MNELELIELYLKNELRGEALNNFDQRLQTDEAFREKVNNHRDIIDGFHYLKMEALGEKLKERNKNLPTLSAKEVKLPKRSTFSILKKLTAAILVLAIGTTVWWNSQRERIPDDFAQTYYFGYYDGTTKSSSDNQIQNSEVNYYRAKSEYAEQNFKICISILNNIQKADSLYLLALYLKQFAYYEDQQFQESLNTYEVLTQLKDNAEYKKEALSFIDAEWTSVLAFINIYKEEKNKPNKKELLNRVKEFLAKSPSRKYRMPAEQLQKWLE